MTDELHCITCDKRMPNILGRERGHQPSGGLAFNSRGHYGTTVFDPMDGSYLELSVCDECLRAAISRGIVFESRKRM